MTPSNITLSQQERQHVNQAMRALNTLTGADRYGAIVAACDSLCNVHQDNHPISNANQHVYDAMLEAFDQQADSTAPTLHSIVMLRDQAQRQGEQVARETGQNFDHIASYQRARLTSDNLIELPERTPPVVNITNPTPQGFTVNVLHDEDKPADKLEAFREHVKDRVSISDECAYNVKHVKLIQQQLAESDVTSLDKLALASVACENMLHLQEHDTTAYNQHVGDLYSMLRQVDVTMPKRTPNALNKRDNLLMFQEEINQKGRGQALQQGENWDYHKLNARSYVNSDHPFSENLQTGDHLILDETQNQHVSWGSMVDYVSEPVKPSRRPLPDITLDDPEPEGGMEL